MNFDVGDAREMVAMFLVLISAISFLAWYGSAGFHPTPEQTAEKMVDEVIPAPIKIIAWLGGIGGGISALLIIGVIWFFYGGKNR